MTSQPDANSRISALGVFAAHGRLRAEHGDALGARLRAGGLDRRHRADERHRKARAQFGERESRGRVAGDDDQIGRVPRDRLSDHADDARDQRVFRLIPVREAGVIREIDVTRVRTGAPHLAEYRQSADAGVEYQDCRRRWHTRVRIAAEEPDSSLGTR